MKLKKIAVIAITGLIAASFLTACTINSNDGSVHITRAAVISYVPKPEADSWARIKRLDITGAEYIYNAQTLAKQIKEQYPQISRIGILYFENKGSSRYRAGITDTVFSQSGYSCRRYGFADIADVTVLTAKACREREALYIIDSDASIIEAITNIAASAGVIILDKSIEAEQ